jgi:hypothetical protein
MNIHPVKSWTDWSGWGCRRWLGLILVMMECGLPLEGQKTPPPSPNPSPPLIQPRPIYNDSKAPDYGPAPDHVLTFEERQYLRYLGSQLKSMSADADKLLKLAKQLNGETDSAKAGTSSREDVKAAAQIEKLARSVKWKLKLIADASQGQ